ncbi:putative hydrolase [Labilithrix luteola]|uniref:Putative hydrolase n=1 Tax=Labilithrix luteola TaxID=1391654 RepID=A0A0K1PWB3_9BACT|nr:alpha/beta hydrolase [Labilithrix luteola]AKU97808.1 putative hydrolase [Labilithrix luteola]
MRSLRSSILGRVAAVLGSLLVAACAPTRSSEAPPPPSLPRVAYNKVEVDGVSIFYREAGAPGKPTLLLLHGFPSSSHMFRDLIPELANDFHLVAPDYPGFGNSGSPSPDEFAYTFDHLADVIEHFVEKIGLRRFALYAQDFGGPVGFRLAARHPDWVNALVVQNANAYDEGLSPMAEEFLRPFRSGRTPEADAKALALFRRDGTVAQYLTGAKNPSAISPDAWNMDQAVLDRPGSDRIQLELQANYVTNLARYPEWHAYFEKHQPPTLVVWGKGDPIFTVLGANAYAKHLRNIEIHLLDTGHFALEEEHAAIAAHIRRFFREKNIR